MTVEYEKMNDLLAKFVSFKKAQNYEPEDLTPYSVFGDFAIYLQEKFISNDIKQSEIDDAFQFFNTLAESDNQDVLNLLVTGIFEVFTDEQKTVELAHSKLNILGRRLFDRTLNGWANSN